MAAMDDTPDLSHLTEEERKIIQEVLERQKVEEKKEHQVQVQYEKELDEVEKQINERKEVAGKQVGTQDDAICQICQRTKFADGIGHKCYYCQLRSCARCGGRTQVKVKPEQKISLPNLANKGQQNGQKTVWACSLCQKKQQILAKTGKWFHKDGGRPTTPTSLSPATTPTPPFQTPGSFRGSVSQEFRGAQPQASSSSLSQQLPIPSQQQQQGASSYSLQRQYDDEIDLESRRHSDADRLPPPPMSQRPSAVDHSVPVPLPMNQSVPQIRSDGRRPENDMSDAQRRREQNLLKQPGVSERRLSANEGHATDQRDNGSRPDLNRKYSEMQPVRHQTSLQRRLSGDRRMLDNAERTNFDQQRISYPTQGSNGRTGEEYNRYNGTGHQTPAGYDSRRPPGDLEAHPPGDDRAYDRIPDRASRPVDLEDRRYGEYENETRAKENGYSPRQISSPDQRMQQPRKQLSPQRGMVIQESGYDAGTPQTSSFDRNSRGSFRGENTLRPNESTWDATREYDSGVGRASRNDEFAPETDRDRRHRSISYSYHAENQPHIPYDERNRNRSFRRPSSQDREAERRDRDKSYGRNIQAFRGKDTYPGNDDRVARRAPQPASPREERRRLPYVSEIQEYPEDGASISKSNYNRDESPTGITGLGSYDRRHTHQYQKKRNRADSRASDHTPRQRKSDASRFGKFPNYADYTTKSVHSPSSSEEADETASTSDFPYGAFKKGFIGSVLGNQRSRSSGDVRASKLIDMLTGSRQGPSTSAAFGFSKQLPVTWQISPDASRLIGRMIFKRQTGVSLGLKVIGGRPTPPGRLSAFITRVQKGSVADQVGQLKPECASSGDEVLEWNGRCLLDVSFDEVCQIINDSKYDDEIDILISRQIGSSELSALGGTNLDMPHPSAFASGAQVQVLDHTVNLLPQLEAVCLSGMVAPGLAGAVPLTLNSQIGAGGPHAPVVMITGPSDVQALAALQSIRQQQLRAPSAQGQIFCSIEIALLYSPADEQLAVTVYQATDLPPRSDGCPRNPYVKLFLLPDRGERSRRQSNILANTCRPVWQQSFIYQKVSQPDLTVKVLEVTLWDYDQFVTNDFLGEVLFDLSMSLLDNEPRWYTLTDMNEESPIRVKLRQLRPSAYSSQGYQTSTDYGSYDPVRSQSSLGMNFGYQQDPFSMSTMPRSRTYNTRYGAQGEDMDSMGVYPKGSGYANDSFAPTRRTRGRSLDPSLIDYYSSDTGLDPQQLSALANDQSAATDLYSRRHLPRVPPDMYGEEALRELDDKVQQLRSQGYVARRHRSASDRYATSDVRLAAGHNKHKHHNHRHHRRTTDQRCGDDNGGAGVDESRRTDETFADMEQRKNAAGYLSDGSETSLSITSTQSEHPRTRTAQEFQRNVEMPPEEQESFDAQDGTMSDSAMANSIVSAKSTAFNADAKRKKSLMTRLIPGRGNAANSAQDQKRLGFRRSDEVGIPSTLSPQSSTDLVKQTSKESTDSNDSTWMPKVTSDGNCLGEFVPGLGPGQVVGRQVLASPCMGEIQLRLADKNGNIEVNVIKAKQLAKKPGAKCNAAPYVKVYLMDGKHCIAKAKTAIAPRTADPKFDQLMLFTEPYKGKLLQISVWGDYGRMERRIFMGIALVKLDKLDLSKVIEGWYKLYHANSLVGTASPARKDSENSAAESSATAVAVT